MTRDMYGYEVADLFGVHPNTVRGWAKSGKLASHFLPSGRQRRYRAADVEKLWNEMAGLPQPVPSHHDLHITTAEIERTSIFDLPYGLEVICNRIAGWELWDHNRRAPSVVPGSGKDDGPLWIAGEFGGDLSRRHWLILDVAGHIIVNSKPPEETRADIITSTQ